MERQRGGKLCHFSVIRGKLGYFSVIWGKLGYFLVWAIFSAGDWNTGKHKPNLVSIPAKDATAKRSPPIWSWWRDMSGLTGFISVFGVLRIEEIKQNVKKAIVQLSLQVKLSLGRKSWLQERVTNGTYIILRISTHKAPIKNISSDTFKRGA